MAVRRSLLLLLLAAAVLGLPGLAFTARAAETPPAPDDAAIAYALSGERGSEIALVRADGTGRRLLTHATNRRISSYGPAWSPDGKTIAFSRTDRPGGEEAETDIWLVNADGTGLRQVTRMPGEEYSPRFSPSGDKLAFTGWAPSGSDVITSIYVLDLASGVVERVTSRGDDEDPDWSPDGRHIVFARNTYGVGRDADQVVLRDLATRKETVVSRSGYAPSWSPDGGLIAFLSTRDRFGAECYGRGQCIFHPELYSVRADGRGLRRLTRTKAAESAATWTSDGRTIVYSRDARGQGAHAHELFAIRRDGTCRVQITNSTRAALSPAWRPGFDSSHVPAVCGGHAPGAATISLDTSLTHALRFRHFGLWYLGTDYRGRFLAFADGLRTFFVFSYTDCSPLGECGKPVALTEASACRSHPLGFGYRRRPVPAYRVRRGALVVEHRDVTAVHAGGTTVNIETSGDVDRVIDDLRPVRGAVTASLPRTALPASVLEEARLGATPHARALQGALSKLPRYRRLSCR